MKLFAILAVILTVTNALDQEFIDNFMEKLQKIGEVCVDETQASADDIADLMDHKIPNSHEGKCMIFCFQKKLNLMKEDGSLDKVGAVLALDELKAADIDLYKKVVEVFIICGQKVVLHEDPCETAAQLVQCGQEQSKILGLDESLLG